MGAPSHLHLPPPHRKMLKTSFIIGAPSHLHLPP